MFSCDSCQTEWYGTPACPWCQREGTRGAISDWRNTYRSTEAERRTIPTERATA